MTNINLTLYIILYLAKQYNIYVINQPVEQFSENAFNLFTEVYQLFKPHFKILPNL